MTAKGRQSLGNNTKVIIFAGANDVFNNVARAFAEYPDNKLKALALLTDGIPTKCAQKDVQVLPDYVKDGAFTYSCVANNVYHDVNALVSSGVSKQSIVLFNLLNFADTPAAASYPVAIKVVLAAIVVGINTKMDNLVASITGDGKVDIFPTYLFFGNMVKNYKDYGFNYSLVEDCVDAYNTDFSTYKPGFCQGYFFYNSKHPTGHAGQCIVSAVKNHLNCRASGKSELVCEAEKRYLPKNTQTMTCSLS